MALYVLADLHLSIGINKQMDIFKGWENYSQKIKFNWEKILSDDDIIILAGDLCWGKTLQEALPSLSFIDKLPGKKIILKGNHDYWWSTRSKMEKFFFENNLSSLNILYNNHYVINNIFICGTRGWMIENEISKDLKLINREIERLKLSIESRSLDNQNYNYPLYVFLHYPPIIKNHLSTQILDVLKYYNVKKCYYGHLHGEAHKLAINGVLDNIHYQLIACDYLNFTPLKIDY